MGDTAKKRRGRLLPKVALMVAVATVMLGLLEVVVRRLDGYQVWTARLTPVADRMSQMEEVAPDLVEGFLAQPAIQREDVDGAWMLSSPEPPQRLPLPPEMQRVFDAGLHPMFLWQWNEALLQSVWVKGAGPAVGEALQKPDGYYVFAPVEPTVFPRYRFPLSVTLPSGVTLNSIGFRGVDVAVDKPAATVRIACVGASTTVDDHQVLHSYPELLGHYLRCWASAHRPGVNFEVINAGCEGYSSTDIVQNVRHYVLPLEVDYVVYYEGANQLHKTQVLQHVTIDGEVPPPPPMAGFLDPEAAATGENQWLYQRSAAARRLHTVFAGSSPAVEPSKPPQRVTLPEGIDEQRPDLARAAEILELKTILPDLDEIRRDCAAAGAQLVLCSYKWLVYDGLELDPVRGEEVFRQLNRAFWPASYASMRRLVDVQNRWFAAWAAARQVPFLDVAACMPDDQRLHTDAIHKTQLGSRCHAWSTFCLLLPRLIADLDAGAVPTPDRQPSARHPNVPPMRRKTAAEFDAEK